MKDNITREEREIEKPFVWTDELVKEFIAFKSDNHIRYNTEDAIKVFKQPKQRKPLFTTEDGVEVFEGEPYFYVFPDEMTVQPATAEVRKDWLHPRLKLFSTREAAEEYIFSNKPVLCYREAKEIGDKPGISWFQYLEKLEQIIKNKIMQ